MTTFAPTATKTNQPLQLFTMFPPPGGASTLKGFSGPAYGTTTTTSGGSTDPLRGHHHFRGSQSMHGEEDGEGSGVDAGVAPVLLMDGPTPHPPLRPVRHVQHATQWAESKTTVAPGLIVRSTTATVNTSQWSEYSTTVTEGVFHGRSSSSSTQFQTIRSSSSTTQSTIAAGSTAPSSSVMTSAQYLDDLQLPTQQLDLAAQLGKGSIARKGSLGGRRPPTIRYRRVNSQGSLPYEEQQQLLQQHQQQQEQLSAGTTLTVPPAGSSAPSVNGTESIRSGRSRTPPPRPPPPVFRQQQQQQPKPVEQPAPVTPVTLQLPPQTDWSCSRSGTPPSLPANSPPPLPDREDLDFVMDEVSSSASVSSSPSPIPGMTDVVEINDKESVGEDGEVVRRRTIITLGPRLVGGGSAAPSVAGGGGGSSGSINITLLNGVPASAGGGPITSSQLNDSKTKQQHPMTATEQQAVANPDDAPQRANARASAFNARRTIEQRRQQQLQQQLQQQKQEEEDNDDDDDRDQTRKEEEEGGDEIQEPEQVREQSPVPVASNVKTPPASTYLYGEKGSPASSFGGSSLRTMSISMSFDDLDESNSNASITEQQRMRSGGRNRSEAWYERRQSYGFEAADKLQSLLNTSGSSDVPSITGTAVSRSCDSLCSTVRSTSSAIEKMIPPWIKNPSPKQADEETEKSPTGSSRLSYFAQSIDDVSADDESEEDHLVGKDPVRESGTSSCVTTEHKTIAQPRRTPTPTSVQRSESSRSATNVLEEAEPIWLRDLRVRRSLRDGRRKPPVIKSPPPIETPVWLGVKLRPTGLSLIDPDPSDGPISSTSHLPSPTKPHNYTPIFTFTNTSTTSKIQQHLRNSRENLLASSPSSSNVISQQTPEPVRKKSEENPAPMMTTTLKVSASSLASSNESREELSNHQTVIESCHNNNTTTFRLVPAKTNSKPVSSSSIVIVNSSRESLHSIGTADNASSFSCDTATSNKLNHHKSIELMRMLEETPLLSTNGIPLRHDRMDSASAVNMETGSVYSMGDWTECSSTIASVKNSNEDLTQINQSEGQRKAKKVAFGADVKEESDQKRSRPRRIRSRSPESRLREWQERLEEVKSTIIHHHQSATVNQHSEFGVGISITAPATSSGGLPLRRFGDDIKETNQLETSTSSNTSASQSSTTSDTFRSLLQPRKPYTVIPTTVVNPVATSPVKESVVIDSYPPMMKAHSTAPQVELSPSRPAPMVIRNGIVNFDSSVERKIVILEEKETIPAPKSILKKRSVENLLDLERQNEPLIKPAIIPVIPPVMPVISVQVVTGSQSVHSGITVSMTNQKKEPPPEQQEILPWRIHLKHVEQPPTINSVAIQQNQPQPEVIIPPWRIELNRKKTPPFVPRASTPENFFSRGRSPASSESSATSIPGMSAAELIRNLRPNPVMMVARCEVRESVFRPTSIPLEPESETVLLPESDPLSVRTDHGYHSLEPEAESSIVKRHNSSSVRQQTTVDETKTIDETIAQLNETIEEIRSLDRIETELDRNGINSILSSDVLPKMDRLGSPSASSSPIKSQEKPCGPPAGLVHSKSASKLPENRFVVREIRPCSAVQPDSRSYFHSTASNEITHHHSTVTSNRRRYSVEAEAPEAKASPTNAQLQRLRETTKLLADGHPQLRADQTAVVNSSASRLSQTNNESNHNRSLNSHKNQNGDVTTSTTMTTVKLASPEHKGRQSFVMASGVERHDVTAVQPSPTIPVVHHKPVEVPELADASVEELLTKFEKSTQDILSPELADPSSIRKSSSVSSSTFNSLSSSTTVNQLRTNKTTQMTKQVTKSSVTAPLAVGINKPQPAKRSNSIELTSGMPEEKAALLVRKFFGNSVIETKKSRIAKTETIMEESSELGCSSSSFSEEKSLLEVAVETFSSPTPPPPTEETNSFDCDDFFHRPSSETEGMSTSSFGSVLDVMTDTTTDDERSTRTTSSMTMTNTSRYSSCSERSVKLSDIINRQDKPSLLDSVPSSPAVTPLMDDFSCTTSESASIAISLCQTTTDSSSTGSAFSRSGSIRRNKTQRHPTVIRKDKSSVPAVTVKTSTRTPTSKSRGGASSSSTPSRGSHHRSCTASPSTSSTPGLRRRSNGSSSVKSTGDSVKTTTPVSKSSASKSASSLAASAAPIRPPRALQQVNQSTEVKRRSLRTSTSGSTLRNATAASSAKAPTATSASKRSPASSADHRTSVTSAGVPLANRTNRLVTITSYKSRNSASAKPDEISAVSGIKVTPVAVGSGHYKIRMDQRIAAAAAEKASKTSTQKISTSRTLGTKTSTTSTTSEKRSSTTTSSSRNTTMKQSDKIITK